jgi:hypothetical protein
VLGASDGEGGGFAVGVDGVAVVEAFQDGLALGGELGADDVFPADHLGRLGFA